MGSRNQGIPTSKSQMIKSITQHQADIAALKEKEARLLSMINMLESLMPFAAVWYMWKLTLASEADPKSRPFIEAEAKRKLSRMLTALEELKKEVGQVQSAQDPTLMRGSLLDDARRIGQKPPGLQPEKYGRGSIGKIGSAPDDGKELKTYNEINPTLKPGSHVLLAEPAPPKLGRVPLTRHARELGPLPTNTIPTEPSAHSVSKGPPETPDAKSSRTKSLPTEPLEHSVSKGPSETSDTKSSRTKSLPTEPLEHSVSKGPSETSETRAPQITTPPKVQPGRSVSKEPSKTSDTKSTRITSVPTEPLEHSASSGPLETSDSKALQMTTPPTEQPGRSVSKGPSETPDTKSSRTMSLPTEPLGRSGSKGPSETSDSKAPRTKTLPTEQSGRSVSSMPLVLSDTDTPRTKTLPLEPSERLESTPPAQIASTLKPGAHEPLTKPLTGGFREKSPKPAYRSGITLSSKSPSKEPSSSSRDESHPGSYSKGPSKSPIDELSSDRAYPIDVLQPPSSKSPRLRDGVLNRTALPTEPSDHSFSKGLSKSPDTEASRPKTLTTETLGRPVSKQPSESSDTEVSRVKASPPEQPEQYIPKGRSGSGPREGLSDIPQSSVDQSILDPQSGIPEKSPFSSLVPTNVIKEREKINDDDERKSSEDKTPDMAEGPRERSRVVREVIEIKRDGKPPETIEIQPGMDTAQLKAVEDLIRRLDVERDNLQEEMNRIFGPLPEAVAKSGGLGKGGSPAAKDKSPELGEASPARRPDSSRPQSRGPEDGTRSPEGRGRGAFPTRPGEEEPISAGRDRGLPQGRPDSPQHPGQGSPGRTPRPISAQRYPGEPGTMAPDDESLHSNKSPYDQRFPGQGSPDQGIPGRGMPDQRGPYGQGVPDQGMPGRGRPDQRGPYGQEGPDQGMPERGRPDQRGPYGQGAPDQGMPERGRPDQRGPHGQGAPDGRPDQRGPYGQGAPDKAVKFAQGSPYGQRPPYDQGPPYGQSSPYGQGSPNSPESMEPSMRAPSPYSNATSPPQNSTSPASPKKPPPGKEEVREMQQKLDRIEARLDSIGKRVEEVLGNSQVEKDSITSDEAREEFEEQLNKLQDKVNKGIERVERAIDQEMRRMNRR